MVIDHFALSQNDLNAIKCIKENHVRYDIKIINHQNMNQLKKWKMIIIKEEPTHTKKNQTMNHNI